MRSNQVTHAGQSTEAESGLFQGEKIKPVFPSKNQTFWGGYKKTHLCVISVPQTGERLEHLKYLNIHLYIMHIKK